MQTLTIQIRAEHDGTFSTFVTDEKTTVDIFNGSQEDAEKARNLFGLGMQTGLAAVGP